MKYEVLKYSQTSCGYYDVTLKSKPWLSKPTTATVRVKYVGVGCAWWVECNNILWDLPCIIEAFGDGFDFSERDTLPQCHIV